MNNTQKFCVAALGSITLGVGASILLKSPSETTPPESQASAVKTLPEGICQKTGLLAVYDQPICDAFNNFSEDAFILNAECVDRIISNKSFDELPQEDLPTAKIGAMLTCGKKTATIHNENFLPMGITRK